MTGSVLSLGQPRKARHTIRGHAWAPRARAWLHGMPPNVGDVVAGLASSAKPVYRF